MTQYYRPSFYGRSGEEAEQFVHLVCKRALDAGKQGDNQWITEFVPTCFKGGALRWFSSLDPTIQNDWKLLQEAIFRQYPSDDVSALQRYAYFPSTFPFLLLNDANEAVGPSRRTTPTPAAAVASAHPGKLLKRGRVRVLQKSVAHTRYLSRTLDREGRVVYTQSMDDALQVEYDTNRDGPQAVIIPNTQAIRRVRLANMTFLPSHCTTNKVLDASG
ncbi:hypothetical protein FRC04_002462 [Tulasnella sp. 424]|nr:hypothetical protein FRC04_002462 [Tulasnella sp. 424]